MPQVLVLLLLVLWSIKSAGSLNARDTTYTQQLVHNSDFWRLTHSLNSVAHDLKH